MHIHWLIIPGKVQYKKVEMNHKNKSHHMQNHAQAQVSLDDSIQHMNHRMHIKVFRLAQKRHTSFPLSENHLLNSEWALTSIN